MTAESPMPGRPEAAAAAAPPRMRTVRSTARYEDAEQLVDRLADDGFPVERVAIVAHGVRIVERVTGRMGLGRAALGGAGTGAAAGALFGFVAGILNWIDPLVAGLTLALYGLLVGAVIGAAIGAGMHAASGGRRDFSSVGRVEAERYDVMADEPVAAEAERALAATGR